MSEESFDKRHLDYLSFRVINMRTFNYVACRTLKLAIELADSSTRQSGEPHTVAKIVPLYEVKPEPPEKGR